jgi:histidinol-phosphate phosphatase family protein
MPIAHDASPGLPPYRRPVRALFVKRWGVLLELTEPPRGLAFDECLLVPGAVDALYRARQAGWRLYLIGNEEAVARGRVSEATWRAFESALLTHLASRGARIARSYACLDHPEGKGPHRKRSVFQLPDTGAFFHAAQHDDVDLVHSWVIGDTTVDLSGGERAGCRVAAVRSGQGLADGALEVEPELLGQHLGEVVDALTSALRRAAG